MDRDPTGAAARLPEVMAGHPARVAGPGARRRGRNRGLAGWAGLRYDIFTWFPPAHQDGLDAASAGCAAWRGRPSAETGEALAAALDHLNTAVQPHLDDEEQKVVPLAAVTFTQQEWDEMGERAFMMHSLPAPVRMLYPILIERPWKKYASTLRNATRPRENQATTAGPASGRRYEARRQFGGQ
jgi:hypothetical protein